MILAGVGLIILDGSGVMAAMLIACGAGICLLAPSGFEVKTHPEVLHESYVNRDLLGIGENETPVQYRRQ
jgi:hypothetical protein